MEPYVVVKSLKWVMLVSDFSEVTEEYLIVVYLGCIKVRT